MNHGAKQTGNRRAGFTLIELMLAMTFISLLLIAIAMAVIQMTGTYNRGLALKEVNQTTRSVSETLRETAAQSDLVRVSSDYIATTAGGNGRLCLGTYSYIWNTVRAFRGDLNADPIKFEGDASRKLQLVRVPDPSKIYCSQPTGTLVYKDIRAADIPSVQELVDPGEHMLALSKFTLGASPVIDEATGEGLYTIDYTITAGDPVTMNADQSACLEPSTAGANVNYCVVQQFSIVLRI